MNANGSEQVNLTDNMADDSFPTWSPDGKIIIFNSHRDSNFEIYGINTGG
jgi:Tol biopolymer transport system component